MNKARKEQVSPVSYQITDSREIMPKHPLNLKGRFTRDQRDRLTSCLQFRPTKDVTPSPFDYSSDIRPGFPRLASSLERTAMAKKLTKALDDKSMRTKGRLHTDRKRQSS